MQSQDSIPRSVREAWWIPDQAKIESLGNNGGFSGASLWKISLPDQHACLRRWPAPHPSEDVLRWQHGILRHAWNNGFCKLPLPIESRTGPTYLHCQKRWWQLEPWISGQARTDPHPDHLGLALVTLAQFHRATEDVELEVGTSRSVQQRLELVDRLEAGLLRTLTDSAASQRTRIEPLDDRLQELFRRIRPLFENRLSGIRHLLRPLAIRSLRPCIRDIWHQHVLFDGDSVSGFVDFGGLAMDLVEFDVARLLGSMAGNNETYWELGFASYEQLSPLTQQSKQTIREIDGINSILTGFHWLNWIWLERRQFDVSAVCQRLDEILLRLDNPF